MPRANAALEFERRFGRPPRWVAASPGRVNLIGEHTDYSGGFVLPMTIDRHLTIAAAPAEGQMRPSARIHSAAFDVSASNEIPLDAPLVPGPPGWLNYVRGVLTGFMARGTAIPAFDALIVSEIPAGGGLASSAALEVATATMLEAISGDKLAPAEKAALCRRAEHEFAGVPCGVMDQLVAVLGGADGPVLIDCRSGTTRSIPLADPPLAVLVCNTGVRHALADGAYADRRAACVAAADRLGVAELRDASPAMVETARDVLGLALYRRARHVVAENARTLAAAEALTAGDAAAAGALMYESHRSLRDDFEVSSVELDTLVDAARAIGEPGGVLGARMTGGGFGGCTVTLVRSDRVASVAARLADAYQNRFDRRLDFFVTGPVRGARMILEPR